MRLAGGYNTLIAVVPPAYNGTGTGLLPLAAGVLGASAQVFEAFCLQITYDKPNRRIEISATITEAIAKALENERDLRRRSHPSLEGT